MYCTGRNRIQRGERVAGNFLTLFQVKRLAFRRRNGRTTDTTVQSDEISRGNDGTDVGLFHDSTEKTVQYIRVTGLI